MDDGTGCSVHGVDGSEAMLLCGKKYLAESAVN